MNKYNNTCAIVVPIYHTTPDELEQLSLKQLNRVIGSEFDVFLIGPDYVDFDDYSKYLSGSGTNNYLEYVIFDDKYFKSNKSYSQLCLSYDFYDTFNKYDYMMIYQTDCWIFRNEIQKFCDMSYDYIGGPIYSPASAWTSLKKGLHPIVGNGGLSLRKISTMLKITNPDGYIYNKYKNEWDKIEYEDYVICDVFSHDIKMNIPDYKIAEKFSLDFLPNNVNELDPMSAHRVFALHQYWNKYIPELNDEHIQNLCEKEFKRSRLMYS